MECSRGLLTKNIHTWWTVYGVHRARSCVSMSSQGGMHLPLFWEWFYYIRNTDKVSWSNEDDLQKAKRYFYKIKFLFLHPGQAIVKLILEHFHLNMQNQPTFSIDLLKSRKWLKRNGSIRFLRCVEMLTKYRSWIKLLLWILEENCIYWADYWNMK